LSRAKNLAIALSVLAVIALLLILLQRDSFRRQRGDSSTAQGNPPVAQTVASEQVLAKPTLVGREVCKECHSENFDLHAHSGHASTFFSASDPRIADKFVDRKFDSGEPFGSYSYFVDEHGLHARRNGSEEETFPLQYALGSGGRGITFLSLLDDSADGTSGIEHRVTWFGTDHELGITPGQHDHVPGTELELFGVAHVGESLQNCVSCHSTTGKVVGTKIVDHVPNVNCEKCHGPGSDHVRQARQSESPPPFSIGRADWTVESEFRLCGSCHRLPDDITRKQLRDYEADLARFQPIGLLRSECYLKSDYELRCTHCHNPHMAAKQKTKAAYQQDCIDCHLENSETHVACPVSPSDGCVECHMRARKLDHGIAFHDHWIRVHAE
jgi:hypothetical protein